MIANFNNVDVVNGIAAGTKKNDIFNIKPTDTNVTVTASKGSDILLLNEVTVDDIKNLSFVQNTNASNTTKDLVITTSNNRIVLLDYFTTTNANATKSSVKTIRIENGTDENGNMLYKDFNIVDLCKIDYIGTFTPKKNKVTGTVFNDTINMYEQTKKLTINGGNGNDVITGGKGNDTIIGGKGANEFIYNEGSGSDTVKLTKGEKLTIKYITSDDDPQFSIVEKGTDVVITRNSDKITIKNMTKNNLTESVIFEAGKINESGEFVTKEVFNIKDDYYIINNNKKTVTGTNLNEMIYGTIGNDTIKGQGGDDIIYANTGNDKLYGGNGADTFVFDTYELNGKFYGSGNDTIMDAKEADIIEFTNSKIEDIKFEKSGKRNLVITYYDQSDDAKITTENTVTIKNYFDKNGIIANDFKIRALNQYDALAKYVSSEVYAGSQTESGYVDTDTTGIEEWNKKQQEAEEQAEAIKNYKKTKSDLETAQEQLTEAENELSDIKDKINAINTDLKKVTDALDALNDGITDPDKKFDITNIKSRVDDLNSQINTLTGERDDYKSQLETKKADYNALVQKIEDLNKLIDDTTTAVDVDALQTKITDLKNALSNKTEDLESLENKVKALVNQIDGTTGDITNLQTQVADLIAWKNTHSHTNDEYDALFGKVVNLIYGTAGDDTNMTPTEYDDIFVPNGGNDIITSADYTKDKMMLWGDIDDVSYTQEQNRNDLIVNYKDGSVVLKNYFNGNGNLNTLIMNGVEYKITDTDRIKILTPNNDSRTISTQNSTVFALAGNDILEVGASNIIFIGGTGNDLFRQYNSSYTNNTYMFLKGDGNDTIMINTVGGNNSTHTLKFNDVEFGDMKFVKYDNTVKIQYTDNDSVTLPDNWCVMSPGYQINKIMDSSGIVAVMTGGTTSSGDNSYSANIADNKVIIDFFTDDNDTLTISDTTGENMKIVANIKADGSYGTLRILSNDNYTDWRNDTSSVSGGVFAQNIENIKSSDNMTVTASELSQLQSDVSAWLSTHTNYADVASAIANKAEDDEVENLVAIFDNFNNTAWNI